MERRRPVPQQIEEPHVTIRGLVVGKPVFHPRSLIPAHLLLLVAIRPAPTPYGKVVRLPVLTNAGVVTLVGERFPFVTHVVRVPPGHVLFPLP